MGEIIKLKPKRKERARVEKRRQADENAARHGRSKAEKDRQRSEADRAGNRLDGHKRET